MTRYVLDACALLAILCNERGQDVVAEVLAAADSGAVKVLMHQANLLEVYYERYRAAGKEKADLFLSEFRERPITILSDIDDTLFKESGRLKASYKVSFADTFALATASVSGGTLLTADHHEMDKIEQSEPGIRFRWIR